MWPFRGGSEHVSALASARATLRVLQDLGRSSTARGVETLGKLTQKGVDVAASGISVVPVVALPALLGRHAGATIVATMRLEKDANGWGLLLLDRTDALRLVDLLLQRPPGSSTQMSALEESAVAETANIALNQMVTLFAKDAGLSVKTSAPETSTDVKGKLAAAGKAPAGDDHAVLVETSFTEKGANVKGTMVLVFYMRAASGK